MMAFFEEWAVDFEALCRSFRDNFTPDCIWENSGFPTTRGPDEAIAKILQPCNVGLGMDTMRVEVLNMGNSRGVVYSERIDHIVRLDGSVALTIPVAGVTEFAPDGRIRHWREYADPTPALALISGESRD
jgi:limonene-1,2-epoxide hydrolase